MVLELFFIIPYLSSRAMKSQQEQKTREQAYAEALKRYQARLEKLIKEGKTQEEAEQILLEERQRRYERLQQLMEGGMSQEEALQVLAEERRQQEEKERAEEEEQTPSTPELQTEEQDEVSTDEEEVEKELYAMMIGRKVNEDGRVVDRKTGIVLGEVVEGKLKRLIGKKVRENGEIYSSKGKLIGRAEPVLCHATTNEDEKEEETNKEEQQHVESKKESKEAFKDSDVSQNTSSLPKVRKSGKVVDENNHTIGYVEKHMAAQLEGLCVHPNGDVIDHSHRVVGQAQMIGTIDESSPEVRRSGKVLDNNDNVVGQVEKQLASKWAGYKVSENGLVINPEGEVVGKAIMFSNTATVRKSGKIMDEDDNIIGHVDKAMALKCAGFPVDSRGNILNSEGQVVGKASLIALEQERNIELSDQIYTMAKPPSKKIKQALNSIIELFTNEKAKSQSDRDEQALVDQVKPLIDQVSSLLKETLGKMGNLDQNVYQNVSSQEFNGEASSEQYNLANEIAVSIKTKAFEREASPDECNLADILACLAADIVSTMNSAKKKSKTMPFAKKQLSASWEKLNSNLLQMTAFIGLLLPTVLWIAGNLLNNRGHSSVIRLLLGELGLNELLMKFGLADALKLS